MFFQVLAYVTLILTAIGGYIYYLLKEYLDKAQYHLKNFESAQNLLSDPGQVAAEKYEELAARFRENLNLNWSLWSRSAGGFPALFGSQMASNLTKSINHINNAN